MCLLLKENHRNIMRDLWIVRLYTSFLIFIILCGITIQIFYIKYYHSDRWIDERERADR